MGDATVPTHRTLNLNSEAEKAANEYDDHYYEEVGDGEQTVSAT